MDIKELFDGFGGLDPERGVRDGFTNMLQWMDGKSALFFLDKSLNFGNQSSTLHLMCYLMAKMRESQFKFARITVVIRADPGDPDSVRKSAEKIQTILWGADADQITANENYEYTVAGYEDVKIAFVGKKEGQPPERDIEADCGFSGGLDNLVEGDENLADRFGIQWFLRLQPYLWNSPVEIHIRGGEVRNISDRVKDMIMHSLPMVPSLEGGWDFYREKQPDRAEQIAMAQVLSVLLQTQNPRTFWLWPVYGLRQLVNKDSWMEGRSDTLISLIYIGMLLLNQHGETGKKIVLVLFDTFSDAAVNKIGECFRNQGAMLEHIENELKNNFGGSAGLIVQNKVTQIKEIWKLLESGTIPKVGNRVKIAKDAAEARQLLEAADSYQVVVLPLGTMPAAFFEQCYAEASLPGIFEGQGTMSTAITIGKAYIQIPVNVNPRGADDVQIYPGHETWGTDLKRKIQVAIFTVKCQYLRSDLKIMYKDLLVETAELLWFLMEDSGDNALRKQMTAPFLKINQSVSRIEAAMAHLNDCIEQQPAPESPAEQTAAEKEVRSGLRKAEAPRTLEELYDRLCKAAEKGIVCFRDEFPEMNFTETLDGFCGEGFSITAGREAITAKGSPVTEVEVSHASGNLGQNMPADISIVFTYDAVSGRILADFRGRLTGEGGKWNLSGIPWIGLYRPEIILQTSEGSTGLTGAVVVSDEKEQLSLGIYWPPEEACYRIRGSVEKPITALDFYNTLCGGVSLLDSLPEPLRLLGGFGLTGMELLYDSAERKLRKMTAILGTENSWKFMESPTLSVRPWLQITVSEPGDAGRRSVSGEIVGEAAFGSAVLLLGGSYPDFCINALLKEGTSLKIAELLAAFGVETDIESSIDRLELLYLPEESWFSIDVEIAASWKFFDCFELQNVSFQLRKDHEKTDIGTHAVVTLDLGEKGRLDFSVAAKYSADYGWSFWGKQSSETGTGLLDLLDYFLHTRTGEWDFPVLELEFAAGDVPREERERESLADGNGRSWKFVGKTAENWKVPFLSDMDVQARVEIGSRSSRTYAMLSADIIWHGIALELAFHYSGEARDGSGSFSVTMGALSALVKKEESTGEWSAELKFTEGTTLGDVIEMVVEWCTGNKRSLDAPWNVLNQLKLPASASLTYNFTTGAVGVNVPFASEWNIGIAVIEKVSLSYKSGEGGNSGRALISLSGKFPWNQGDGAVGDENTLGPWDAAQPDSAPAPDGAGSKYFDLRLLALGQNIALEGLSDARSISEAMECFQKVTVPDGQKGPGVTYCEGNHWLFGAEFGVLRFEGREKGQSGYLLEMQMVYHDPALYGLRFALNGESARIFKGFQAEILYRKVNDTIGVYQGELTLPDRMRHLELGAFSLTLPVFYLEIYTNGDFKVDVGFPRNGDFSRSLSLYAIVPPGLPLTGSAGFYFGKLSAATADMVPVTDKGFFQPVFVFGLGIKAGLGKSIEAGVLKAGFELTVMTILEGVLAKWNPYPQYAPSGENYYFRLSGMAGIDGRLYGSVDFAIIRADLDVAVRLVVQFVYETYRKLLLAIEASVSVKAGITLNLGIFKISIHFSFSMRIEEKFTIGRDEQAPWDMGNSCLEIRDAKEEAFSFRWEQLAALKEDERIGLRGYLGGALSAAVSEKKDGWTPVYVLMILLPSMEEALSPEEMSVMEKEPAIEEGTAMEKEPSTKEEPGIKEKPAMEKEPLTRDFFYREWAGRCRELSMKKACGEEPDSDFETLCKMLVRYLAAALLDLGGQTQSLRWDEVDKKSVTPEMAEYIKNHVEEFDHEAITRFLQGQIWMELGTEPGQELHGVPFPMPDGLTVSDGQSNYSFGSFTRVSTEKLKEVKQYFDALAIQVEQEQKQGSRDFLREEKEVSMSHWMFGDYFQMLAKQLAQGMYETFREKEGTAFSVGEMLSALQARGVFEHLAGMVSHFQFHGLRIPVQGISFSEPARQRILGQNGDEKKTAGIFALTGQQIALPEDVLERPYGITFSKTDQESEKWYDVAGGRQTIVIHPDEKQSGAEPGKDLQRIREIRGLQRFAVAAGTLQGEKAAEVLPAEYNFANGIPFEEGQIYSFPRVFAGLLEKTECVKPKFSWEILSQGDRGLKAAKAQAVHTGVMVHIRVRPASRACVYEISCTDANEPKLLKKLYRQIGGKQSAPELLILYGGESGYWRDPEGQLDAGIIKSNLSTVTHPVTAFRNGNGDRILGGVGEFVLYLWEAFVTNSGGFYLYYDHGSRKGKGLPEEIFSEEREAVLTILLAEKDDRLLDCHNAVWLEEALEDQEVLLARSLPYETKVSWGKEDTIESVCSRSHSCLVKFSDRNKNLPLSKQVSVRAKWGIYQYLPGTSQPGRELEAIAEWFGVEKSHINAANPGRKADMPMEDNEAIRLPEAVFSPGDRYGGTAEEIAAYFGMRPEQFFYDNAAVPGLFETETAIEAGPFVYRPRVFDGALTFMMDRQSATENLRISKEEGIKEFLENNYTMLEYKIRGNVDFEESNPALPLAPASRDEAWKYEFSVPYSRYNSGIGQILQQECRWVDIFGNEGYLEAPSGSGAPILTGYTQELTAPRSWPSCALDWRICDGKLEVRISFDSSAYGGESGDGDCAKEGAARAEQDLYLYKKLKKQLLDENGLEIALRTSLLEPGKDMLKWEQAATDRLRQWMFGEENSIWAFLQERAAGNMRGDIWEPGEFAETFPIPREVLNPGDAFRLYCEIILKRNRQITGAGMQGAENMLRLSEELPVRNTEGSEGQKAFVESFENAFCNPGSGKLKLALGSEKEWWCVRMAEKPGNGFYLAIEQEEPEIFVPRPVRNCLWSPGCPISLQVYETGKGILEDTKEVVLEDIDPDVWLEELFLAVDGMFAEERIVSVRILDEIFGISQAGNSYYKRLVSVKKQLALLGRDFLIPVYAQSSGDGAAQAKEAFYQKLLTKLENFYTTHAVMTWKVSADTKKETEGMRLSLEAEAASVVHYAPEKVTFRQGGTDYLAVCVQAPKLVKAQDGAVISRLTDKISIKGNFLEYDIKKLPEMEDYEDSSWLSLLYAENTCLQQELKEFTVPFVLRGFPDTPKLGKQSDGEEPKSIKDFINWEYRMSYEMPFHFPQDEVELTVIFNPKSQSRVYGVQDGLEVRLAQFSYLHGAIDRDLETYLKQLDMDMEKEQEQTVNAKAALESFLTLAESAAASKAGKLYKKHPRKGAASCTYTVQERTGKLNASAEEENAFITELRGQFLQGAGTPVVYVLPEEYEPVCLSKEDAAVSYWYRNRKDGTALPAARAQQTKERQVGIPGLNLFCYQSAVSEITVNRNRSLAEGKQTAEAFIYTTGTISFGDVYYVSRDVGQELDITELSGKEGRRDLGREVTDFLDITESSGKGGRTDLGREVTDFGKGERMEGERNTISGYLRQFFDLMMGGSTEQAITLQMEALYARKFGEKEEINVPVYMQPCRTFQGKAEESIGRQIEVWEQGIKDWCGTHLNYGGQKGPWNETNKISLNLTVFSNQTDRKVPLLRLQQLVIPGSKLGE